MAGYVDLGDNDGELSLDGVIYCGVRIPVEMTDDELPAAITLIAAWHKAGANPATRPSFGQGQAADK